MLGTILCDDLVHHLISLGFEVVERFFEFWISYAWSEDAPHLLAEGCVGDHASVVGRALGFVMGRAWVAQT